MEAWGSFVPHCQPKQFAIARAEPGQGVEDLYVDSRDGPRLSPGWVPGFAAAPVAFSLSLARRRTLR